MGRPRKTPPPITTVKELPPELVTNDVRGLLSQVMDEEATIEGIRELVREGIGATTVRQVECPSCGEKFRAKVPDTKKAADTLIAFLEQKEGKAGERPPSELSIVIERRAFGA